MTRLFRASWAEVSSLHNNATRSVLRSPLLTSGNWASVGLSVSPTVNKWWSGNQNTGLFCIKAGILSTIVYYRKEGITGALKPLHSFFFFRGRVENSSAFPCWWWLFRRTMCSQGWWPSLHHSGWTSYPWQPPLRAQRTAKHHPLGCFVPFKQG